MGFVLKINGEKAWESEGDHALVTAVTLRSAQGEAGVLNVPNDMQEADVIITERDTLESEWLDINTRTAEQERASRIEEASSDRVSEGRAEMEAAASDEEQQTSADKGGDTVAATSQGGSTRKSSKESVEL